MRPYTKEEVEEKTKKGNARKRGTKNAGAEKGAEAAGKGKGP